MEITNISDFTKELASINADPNFSLFFRGHSTSTYDLKPNLYRKATYYENEHKIYRETIVNCPHEFEKCENTLEVLVRMQHYGIPTRILDLTRNALVALYFSCISKQDKDGEVIILKIPNEKVCYYDSDKVTIISNIAKVKNDNINYKVPISFDESDEDAIEDFNNRNFGYLLHAIKEDKPHFFNIINPKHLNDVYAVNVKLDNPRIIRQNGAFLIFGINEKKENCPNVNSDWILEPNGEKIIIPAKSKSQLLEELEVLGISKYNLFPELDDYAEYLKSKFA